MSERFDRTRTDNKHVGDLLSDYIDSRLDKGEQTRVRQHLEVCVDCRADYIGLRATRQMLRSLPTVPPPRAFTLTQEMVAAKPGFWNRLMAPRNSSRFALGSALSFTLLVFLLVGNFVTSAQLTANSAAPTVQEARAGSASTGQTADNHLPSTASNDSAGAPAAGYSNYSNPQAAATPQIGGVIVGERSVAPAITDIPIVLAAPPMTMSNPVAASGGPSARPPQSANPLLLTPQPTVQGVAQAPPVAEPSSKGTVYSTIEPVPTLNAGISAGMVGSPSTNGLDSQNVITMHESSGNGTSTPGTLYRYDSSAPVTETQPFRDQAIYRNNSSLSPTLIAEASLALLGVALAAGALLARRR